MKPHSTMTTWKSKQIKKKNRGSQTPGRQKNPETCQADALKKYFARSGRSYKHNLYSEWCKWTDKVNH